MKRNPRGPILLVITLLLLLALPAGIFLAQTSKRVRSRADAPTATIGLQPTQSTIASKQLYPIDIYVTSDTAGVSAATISLTVDQKALAYHSLVLESGEGKPFTSFVHDPVVDAYTFTLIAEKPSQSLPRGTFKIGQITFTTLTPGAGSVSINMAKTSLVGSAGGTDAVQIQPVAGTQAAYTISGTLCPVTMCIATSTIEFTTTKRPDDRYSVTISWDEPQTASPALYYIYRNIDQVVPVLHPIENLVGASYGTSFMDTNQGAGFEPADNVHYDIDTYTLCP